LQEVNIRTISTHTNYTLKYFSILQTTSEAVVSISQVLQVTNIQIVAF
jgi:hypothetical protein